MSQKNSSERLSEKLRPCRIWLYLFAGMTLIALIARSNTMEPSVFRVILLAFRNLALSVAPDFFASLGIWYAEFPLAQLLVTIVYLCPLVGFGISVAWAFGFRIRPSITFPKEIDSAPTGLPAQPASPAKEMASPLMQWAEARQQRALDAHRNLIDFVSACQSPYCTAYNAPVTVNAPVIRLQDFSTSPRDEILEWDEQRQCVVSVGQLELLLDYTEGDYDEFVPRIFGATQDGDTLVEGTCQLEPDKPLVILRQEAGEPRVRCALTWIGG